MCTAALIMPPTTCRPHHALYHAHIVPYIVSDQEPCFKYAACAFDRRLALWRRWSSRQKSSSTCSGAFPSSASPLRHSYMAAPTMIVRLLSRCAHGAKCARLSGTRPRLRSLRLSPNAASRLRILLRLMKLYHRWDRFWWQCGQCGWAHSCSTGSSRPGRTVALTKSRATHVSPFATAIDPLPCPTQAPDSHKDFLSLAQ